MGLTEALSRSAYWGKWLVGLSVFLFTVAIAISAVTEMAARESYRSFLLIRAGETETENLNVVLGLNSGAEDTVQGIDASDENAASDQRYLEASMAGALTEQQRSRDYQRAMYLLASEYRAASYAVRSLSTRSS